MRSSIDARQENKWNSLGASTSNNLVMKFRAEYPPSSPREVPIKKKSAGCDWLKRNETKNINAPPRKKLHLNRGDGSRANQFCAPQTYVILSSSPGISRGITALIFRRWTIVALWNWFSFGESFLFIFFPQSSSIIEHLERFIKM